MRRGRMVLRAVASDPQRLLSIALAVGAVLLALPIDPLRVAQAAALGAIFLLLFELASWRRIAARDRDIVRLLLAIGVVAAVSITEPGTWPTPSSVLFLPVVAYGAASGHRTGLTVGLVSMVVFTAPMAFGGTASETAIEQWLGLSIVGTVLAIGTRRTIRSLERALDRSRAAHVRDRRRSRQLATVEAIGHQLAMEGPTPAAIDAVVGTLADRFGYQFVSLYLGTQSAIELAAERGYDNPITRFDGSRGVVSRVMRDVRPVFLADAAADPDFLAATDGLVSEICVPLIAEGTFRGLINVEATSDQTLDRSDLAAISLVAERVASAIALGERHAEARARATLFQGLTSFGRSIAELLEPGELHSRIVELVSGVVPCDMAVLVVRDAGGSCRIVAIHGGDTRYVGVEIQPGEGITGQAMATGSVVVEQEFDRSRFPAAVKGAAIGDVFAGSAVPLIHNGEVIGALGLIRFDTARLFTTLEREVLPLLGAHVALAVQNVRLHAELADTSVRDALTGLYNRRHLDASLERFEAVRRRLPVSDRRPAAAIMFDLDRFGEVNKLYGHQVGDEVLRRFASVLLDRFRSSDIVGRYGGEEFLALLDGASRSEAVRIAEDVRRAMSDLRVTLPDGRALRTTVSAGCSGLGPDVESTSALIEIADVALQTAKRAGRDKVVAA